MHRSRESWYTQPTMLGATHTMLGTIQTTLGTIHTMLGIIHTKLGVIHIMLGAIHASSEPYLMNLLGCRLGRNCKPPRCTLIVFIWFILSWQVLEKPKDAQGTCYIMLHLETYVSRGFSTIEQSILRSFFRVLDFCRRICQPTRWTRVFLRIIPIPNWWRSGGAIYNSGRSLFLFGF
jgi:hypothetical protein